MHIESLPTYDIENKNQTLENQMVLENTQGSFQNSNLPLQNTDCEILQSVISPFKKVNTGNKTEVDCIISGTYCHPFLTLCASIAIFCSEGEWNH